MSDPVETAAEDPPVAPAKRPRLFLCGITSAGKEANLRALIEPIRSAFDGLCWTFHLPDLPGDGTAPYLESQVGAGRIVYARYSGRHGSSMTQYLWQGPMEDGDYFVQIDDLERLSVQFCVEKLPLLIAQMESHHIAMIANCGKGLIYRFNEQLEFRGSPHWYATGLDGQVANLELPLTDFWNVRAEQRDPFHWVGHYVRYWLLPAGSNHALLGLDHHPGFKPGEEGRLFQPREERRLEFRREMRRRGFPLTLDGLKAMLSGPLDATLKAHLNAEKTLSDYYHFVILGDKTVVDTHKPSDAKLIP